MREARTLSRDIEATAIPYGDRIPLSAGTTVFITQALGGTYTVMTDMGSMVRLEAQDADAIGEQVQAAPSPEERAEKSTQEQVWDQLKTCYDPEIPVNIVDLGLVYACELTPLPDGGQRVSVRFTLTAPGCGMGDYLKQDIERKVAAVPGIQEIDAQIAFEPSWDPSRMSEAAKLQLGML